MAHPIQRNRRVIHAAKIVVAWVCFPFCLLVTQSTLRAQRAGAVKAAPMGMITGHVYLADSNAPARFATVVIEPVKAFDESPSDSKEKITIHAASVQTLLDGSFVMPRVAPGSYYVIASCPGYLSAFAALGETADSLRNPDKALKEKVARLVPRVTVQANLPANIDLRLERGASISGTVRYDDGSAASDLEVSLLMKQKKKDHKDEWVHVVTSGFMNSARGQTNDEGGFRISGLSAGEYLVQIDLSLILTEYDLTPNGSGSSTEEQYSLPVFSGGFFRQKAATPVELKLGDPMTGEDIQIPLSKIHSVSGVLVAARDGHLVNGGSVALLNADDQTMVATTGLTRDSTTFTFSFVPEGDYLLRVMGAKDVDFEEIMNKPGSTPAFHVQEHLLHSYGSADLAIHVGGDTNGLAVSVPESAAGVSGRSMP